MVDSKMPLIESKNSLRIRFPLFIFNWFFEIFKKVSFKVTNSKHPILSLKKGTNRKKSLFLVNEEGIIT